MGMGAPALGIGLDIDIAKLLASRTLQGVTLLALRCGHQNFCQSDSAIASDTVGCCANEAAYSMTVMTLSVCIHCYGRVFVEQKLVSFFAGFFL